MDLSGTAALVTGAVSGLGAATAAHLAAQGATLLDLDTSVANAESPPHGVQLLTCDVTAEEPVR